MEAIPDARSDDDLIARIDSLADDGERALALLDQLPPAQRDAIRAHVLEDVDYREFAARTGCSEQVARQHVSRGLRRLRIQLTEDS